MQHRSSRFRLLALALVVAASGISALPSSADVAACASDHPGGGDWPTLNGSAANTRNQALETTIDATNVAQLTPAWSFTSQSTNEVGSLHSTPIVGEGCVFITNSAGYVYAFNADSGELVWSERFEETVQGVCCGGTMFAPALNDGVLYINVSHNPETATDTKGPYVLALNAHTGDILWKSEQVAWEPGSYTNSSAVFVENGDDDLVIIGISNPEDVLNQTGGFALVDASPTCSHATAAVCNNDAVGADGGSILKRTRTVTDAQYAQGMGGGSIWTTAAVDDDLYAYAGTGQPSCWTCPESEYVNAIIKFDVDANRSTFGQIVDVLKGDWDSEPRPDQVYYIDVDFAASPTLYEDEFGQQMVAELQKSGWVHAGHTDRMSRAWKAPVSAYGTALGNYSTTTTDGNGTLFVHGTYPGSLWSINGTTGLPNWVVPAPTLVGANPLTYANGVVWLASGLGVLHAYDAATGAPLLARPMAADAGGFCMNAGGGVAIARNTVFAVCGDGEIGLGANEGAGGYLIAYRLP